MHNYIIWIKVILYIFIEIAINMILDWLKVNKVTSFLMSHSVNEFKLAVIILFLHKKQVIRASVGT